MSDHVELRHLRAFVAVAEELNFSRAARKVNMVQQSLSAQVQQLERELGVRLFRRTTRRVELNDAGAVLLDQAREILALVASAAEQVRRAAAGEIGRLAIAYTPTLAAETLPTLVDAVHACCPELTLQICEMWQTESIEAVRVGRLDAGLARCPEIPDELDHVALRNEPIGVVLGEGHPLADEPRLTMEQLADLTLAIWPRQFSPGFFDRVVDSYREHGFRGRIQEFEFLTSAVFLSDPAARGAMTAGQAFSVAFETQFARVPEGFVWRAVEPAPLIPVQLYWRRGGGSAVRRFVDVALEVSRRRGWQESVTALAPATQGGHQGVAGSVSGASATRSVGPPPLLDRLPAVSVERLPGPAGEPGRPWLSS